MLWPSRCSLLGLDLNRGWIDATPLSHPTLDAVQNLLADLNQRKVIRVATPRLRAF